jgi:hypothetical protein
MKPTPAQLVQTAMHHLEDDDNVGVCVECGASKYNCEPDARKYKCDDCGAFAVYGAEEIMICEGVID